MTVEAALLRLASRPLAIAPRALETLLVAGRVALAPPGEIATRGRGYAVSDAGIAVVPVLGPLVARGDWLTELFGASVYGEIGEAVEAALADPSVRGVVMEIDSPGGEVAGMFDLADRLTSLRGSVGKPLWAVASESATSAAYAIASAAERIYVTRTGEVGSIGVVAAHIDQSGADAKAGFAWTFIHAGARKLDGNPHEPLSDPARMAIQADVDALYGELVSLVARNRNLTPEAVRATEAAIYRGRAGIALGLADRVGTIETVLADMTTALAAPAPRRGATTQTPARRVTMTHPVEPDDAPVPETQDEPQQEVHEAAPPEPAPAPPDDAARAAAAEIAEVAAQAARLGVTVDAADAIRRGVAAHVLRRSVLDTLASRAEASAVIAAAPKPGSADESPIVRRARERAAAARS
ncbi:S49 family peptidase [Elioraea sp. Yellowstone]|uniref:S49 family peptidase n=1 Tax=Elioraea sp. Yellowstone TaxID=2592070 RepID=UPI00114ED81A|nr:S49 family peptidase [Elioraea sp. Yellowstone]TQF85243.1 S49 family peptidase [Elioraea sp. Yellowstone]